MIESEMTKLRIIVLKFNKSTTQIVLKIATYSNISPTPLWYLVKNIHLYEELSLELIMPTCLPHFHHHLSPAPL